MKAALHRAFGQRLEQRNVETGKLGEVTGL